MRTSSLLVALSFALFAFVGVVSAQDQDTPACSWATAQRVTIRQLDRSEHRLKGRCVRVSGWLNGWAIYSNRQERNSNHLETTFVGAYFDEPALADALQDRPRSGQALGVVGHCADVCADNYRQWEEERAAAEREGREPSQDLPFCMPVGFCHYYDDPYVSVQQVR